MINDAIVSRDQEVKGTLARLEKSDSSAAGLLRELLDELNDVRANGSHLSPDLADMLSIAARDRRGLEDRASLLRAATFDLRGLEDKASMLSSAAREIN